MRDSQLSVSCAHFAVRRSSLQTARFQGNFRFTCSNWNAVPTLPKVWNEIWREKFTFWFLFFFSNEFSAEVQWWAEAKSEPQSSGPLRMYQPTYPFNFTLQMAGLPCRDCLTCHLVSPLLLWALVHSSKGVARGSKIPVNYQSSLWIPFPSISTSSLCFFFS